MIFIDADIFVHYFTADHPEKSVQALRFFQALLDDSAEATTSESVLAEAVWVLSSKTYRVSRDAIAEGMVGLLQLAGLKLSQKDMYIDAFNRFGSSHLDIADCLTIAHMQRQGITEIVSYDRDFDRLPAISRIEPQERFR
jgi:predicted nucleic acid-binding protein